jgi:hypothetical protein
MTAASSHRGPARLLQMRARDEPKVYLIEEFFFAATDSRLSKQSQVTAKRTPEARCRHGTNSAERVGQITEGTWYTHFSAASAMDFVSNTSVASRRYLFRAQTKAALFPTKLLPLSKKTAEIVPSHHRPPNQYCS